MIDTKSTSSTIDQLLMAKIMQPEITPSELQQRAIEIEEVARVDVQAHKASMEFLNEMAGNEIAAALVAGEEVGKEEAKRMATDARSNDQAGALAAGETVSQEQAAALAAAEGITVEEAKKKIAEMKQNSDGKTGGEITDPGTGSGGGAGSAEGSTGGAEGSAGSTEGSQSGGAGTAGGSGSAGGATPEGTLNPDGSITRPDGSVIQTDGSIHHPDGSIHFPDGTIRNPDGSFVYPEGVTPPGGTLHPFEPPNPPAPPYPPGFDIESLITGSMKSPSAFLTEISLLLGDAMKKLVEGRIDSQRELTLKTSDLQQARIADQTAEQVEALEKQEQASKVGTCISIAISVAMTIIAIASVVVSGGSSIALIGLGVTVGLMLIDGIMTAAGETPLTALIMDPIMTHVIMPVIQFLADIFMEFFMLFPGADEEAAEIASMVLGAVVVAAVIIAAVVASKNSAMLKAFGSAMGKAMGAAFAKITPSFIQTGLKAMSQSISGAMTKAMARAAATQTSKAAAQASATAVAKGATKEAAEELAEQAAQTALKAFMKQASGKVTTAAIVTGAAGGIGMSASQIAQASFNKDSTFIQATINQIADLMAGGSQEMSKFAEQFAEVYRIIQQLMDDASEAEKGRIDTAKAILGNMPTGV